MARSDQLRGRYEVLWESGRGNSRALRPSTPQTTPAKASVFPVSIKGVLFTSQGEVVLLMNERDEWELPGGRIETEESPEKCVEREITEELGVSVAAAELLDSYLFEVIPGKHVFIMTYGCALESPFRPRLSEEHKQIGTFPPNRLPANLPPGYRSSIAAWHRRLTVAPIGLP